MKNEIVKCETLTVEYKTDNPLFTHKDVAYENCEFQYDENNLVIKALFGNEEHLLVTPMSGVNKLIYKRV